MSEQITYLSEIICALDKLGGMGSLKEINEMIINNGRLPALHSNPNWKDNVRATIQRHCSQTKSFDGSKDLFYSVYGIGEGFWGLKNHQIETSEHNPIEQRQIDIINRDKQIENTEKDMLIKARIGQGVFRDLLLKRYGACVITGINDERLLVASHIKPWRSADNYERLSVNNGLLLSPLYDKLFDIGLISFDKKMKIIISNHLSDYNINLIGIDTQRTYFNNLNDEMINNLAYHRNNIFR